MSATTREAPFSHLLYRFFRAVNRRYALTVLWCYLGAFVLAFLLMFIFPLGTLLLVFLGIFGLVASMLAGQLIGAIEHHLARTLLRRGQCPRCGQADMLRSAAPAAPPAFKAADQETATTAVRAACIVCGAEFESWGGEVEQDESSQTGRRGGGPRGEGAGGAVGWGIGRRVEAAFRDGRDAPGPHTS